ncbi:hypothetical protein Tco_1246425 [Tanacetum coccineum]
MCTYLKNMAGWKPKDLKSKSFANIQELFDKAFKRVNTFVDFRTELVEGTEMEESSKKAEVMEESSKKAEIAQESSSKRAGDELEQENAKKEDLETLSKLVKAKHGYRRPEEGYERVLWRYLKTIAFHGHISFRLRNGKSFLWFLQLNGSLQPIKDDSLDV